MRARARTGFLAVAAILVLVATPAQPQAIQNLVLRNSFTPAGAGARGLGMGGAFIAVADDGTAASFNPAGLAQLRHTELAFVGFRSDLESTLTFARSGSQDSQVNTASHGAPEFAGLAVPFEVGGRNLTVQLAYQRSVDLFGRGSAFVSDTFRFEDVGVDLPGSGTVVADVSPEQTGAFHTVSLAAGYQVTERLSLGLSTNYWIGDWTSRGNTNFRFLSSGAGTELLRIETLFDQAHHLEGLNVNLGLLLRYPWLSIGGVARLPFAGGYDLEEATSSRFSGPFAGELPIDTDTQGSVTTRLRWPVSTGLGIAIRPLTGLTLAADVTRSAWSRTVIEALPNGALLTTASGEALDPVTGFDGTFVDRNFFDLQPAPVSGTRDTRQWRLGAEYLVQLPSAIVPLRVGGFKDHSPIVDLATGEPREIEGFTVGGGVSFSSVAIDFAFERRETEGAIGLRLRQGQPVSTSGPSEAVVENRFVASLIYRFGPDDPIKRFLRRVFVGPDEEDEP